MRLVCEAVHERTRAAFERFDNARGNQHRAERRVTARDSLPHQNQVWLDTPVLNGKRLSGAAHAGHDFVGDEKYPVFAADFGDTWNVTIRRHGSTERRANN